MSCPEPKEIETEFEDFSLQGMKLLFGHDLYVTKLENFTNAGCPFDGKRYRVFSCFYVLMNWIAFSTFMAVSKVPIPKSDFPSGTILKCYV